MMREPYIRVPGPLQALRFAVVMSFGVCLQSPGEARTWKVHEDGLGDAPTVQAGIDSAAAGDTVLVGPGTYGENISFRGKNIVVRSEFGVAGTTLDGSQEARPVVVFPGGESQEAILQGFTITGGNVPGGSGGGIYCGGTSSPRVVGNRIAGNQAEFGGGMHAGDPTATGDNDNLPAPIIETNIFEENIAGSQGGGLRLASSKASILDNVFRRNRTVVGDGGGIDVALTLGIATIQGNEFWENVANDKGGGINGYTDYLRGAGPLHVIGNLFVRNEALGADTGDSGAGGGLYVTDTRGSISRNTFAENVGVGESPCGGGGITIAGPLARPTLSHNLIAYNRGCGIRCKSYANARADVNLFWENEGGDLGIYPSECPYDWGGVALIQDPQFCDLGADDYSVAASSPALTYPDGSIGVYEEPGCGPVRTQRITWGALKSRYR